MKLNLAGVSSLCVWLAISSGLFGAKAAEVPLSNQVATAAQWRAAVVPGAGGNTLEIFVANTGDFPLVFGAIKAPGADLYWAQWYPDSNAAPGETVVARLNFKRAPAPGQERGQRVILDLAEGRSLSVPLPPFRVPEKPISAITFTPDYSRIFIQYRSPNAALRKLWINSRPVTNYVVLAGMTRNDLAVLACAPPTPIKTGQAVYVKIQFKDGREARALVRALSSVILDAFLIPAKERPKLAAQLGVDMEPALVEFGVSSWYGDPACYDLKISQPGAAAIGMIAERMTFLRSHQGKLSFLHYCTGYYTALWNVYGSVADMAFSSYYGLSHWQNVSRWVDNEEQFMDKAWRSAQPAPWGWIPDVFRRKARFAEPDELRTLAWVALAKGCKVIKYFAWHLDMPKQEGFDKCPILAKAIANLNKTIVLKQAQLAPLIPVSERIDGDPKSGLKIYTAWAGDQGLLAVVRNLDYRTDDLANDNGAAPRFRVNVKTNVVVALNAPAWLKWQKARDFLTDESLPTRGERPRPVVELATLEAFKVLWLAHEPLAAVEAPAPQIPVPVTPPPMPKESGRGLIRHSHFGDGGRLIIILAMISLAVLVVGLALWRRRRWIFKK